MYLDTDVVLALAKKDDWLKAAATRAVRRHRPLRTSALTLVEAELVLEREVGREAALAVRRVVTRRRVEVIPLSIEILAEADKLRRRIPVLHLFDGIHLATAKLAGETILSSDLLFAKLGIVPVESLRDDRE